MVVTLGNGATVTPGDALVFNHSALRSADGVSAVVPRTSLVVAAPVLAVAPVVSIRGHKAVGPCDTAVLTAAVSSTRPLVLHWACSNDASLNDVLQARSGLTVSLSPSDIKQRPFKYEISLVAVNFLGVSSDVARFVLESTEQAVPVVTPSNVPDRILTVSDSLRWVVKRLCPGRRLSSHT